MGRRRVRHELISNESSRKVTFKKRKAGLLKKLRELSTLCGVDACSIIFSSQNPKPDVWPSPEKATHVLDRFKNLPTKKQGKYMMDEEVLHVKNVSKLSNKLEKLRATNQNLEFELASARCMCGEIRDAKDFENLNGVISLLEEQIGSVIGKIDLNESM